MPRVLVDTNLLLLLAVGLTDRSYVARHRRLTAFDLKDFDALYQLVDSFEGLVSCPNVWSETSNLIRYVSEPMSGQIAATLKRLIDNSDEVFTASENAARRKEYSRLGITDAVLLAMAQAGDVLLTDDFPVYLAAANAGYQAINYNHIREARYDRER